MGCGTLELCADFVVSAALLRSIFVGGSANKSVASALSRAAWRGRRGSQLWHICFTSFSTKNLPYKNVHVQQFFFAVV